MASYSFKAVYIIAAMAAVAILCVPGPGSSAHAQVSLPSVGSDLTRIPRDLGVDRRIGSQTERMSDHAMKLAESWVDTAEMTAEQAAAQATGLADGLLRELQVVQDPAGADIEARVVVVLVETVKAAGMLQPGFEIISEREMSSLGMTLLTLRVPAKAKLPQAVKELRDDNPEAVVDYNHLYDFASSASQPTAGGVAAIDETATRDQKTTMRVGIIDSAVMREHRGLADINIVMRDFATSPGLRPQTHGTAVASLIAKSSNNRAEVYAASVFFQLPNRAPGATAESLVTALDWLVEEEVDVINMSLAGPGNQLLEAAMARLVQMDAVVVAAVGNNGPSGDALYPAAYEGVIGVTAVDKKNKIFRYANRGEQVEFAARGVDVKVADSLSGGWRIESGTSMASPHVAVIVAEVLRADSIPADALTSWLMANAEDLGRKGFDKVYGHGLITQAPAVLSVN